MSVLIVPNEGKLDVLNLLTNGSGLTLIRLGLFQNNVNIAAGTVFGDFQLATFSGYAVQTPTFGTATLVNNKGQTQDTTTRTFTCNGGGVSNTIYGYLVYDAGLNVCLWAEKFDNAQVMTNNGDAISIRAKITLDSAN